MIDLAPLLFFAILLSVFALVAVTFGADSRDWKFDDRDRRGVR
jgi:hypothetical protein